MRNNEDSVKESAAIAPENALITEEVLPAEAPAESAAEPAEESMAEPPAEAPAEPAKKKKKRRKIHEITPENDIKFRGPLSYRHFKIIGWICIAVSQVGMLMTMGSRMDPIMAEQFAGPLFIIRFIGGLALPFLLFANFAIILNAREGYKKLLIKYAALIAGIGLVFLIFYLRYLKGTLALIGGEELTPERLMEILEGGSYSGFFAFNIFVDLFLCTLFMFFLNYKPKCLKGKALLCFRLLALLPLIYEIASIVLKIRAGQGLFTMPVWMYPLLTTKPPLAFIMFTIVGLILKRRERRYFREGGSEEGYNAFWQTNANSWHFSLFTSIVVFITALLDIITYFFMTVFLSTYWVDVSTATDAEIAAAVDKTTQLVDHLAIGDSINMLLLIPFLLLFSYTRKHKNNQIDALIPLAGIVLIILIYLEGGYQLLEQLVPHLLARLNP